MRIIHEDLVDIHMMDVYGKTKREGLPKCLDCQYFGKIRVLEMRVLYLTESAYEDLDLQKIDSILCFVLQEVDQEILGRRQRLEL